MKIILAAMLCCTIPFAVHAEESPEAAALRVLDEFMEAFNARDPRVWAETFNYPHVRIASGSVATYASADEVAAGMNFGAFAKTFNWDHSAWDSREIVQAGKDKVHVVVRFSRYDAEGKVTKSFDSLYIVTLHEGHWGVQARSSFAP